MGKLLTKHGHSNETARKLSAWDPYDQNATSPFFDPEWMFGIADGFDVVIGNPPYVQLQKDGGKLANLYKSCGYKTFERTSDIYALFYENGVNLLSTGGHLCFITSNKWMRGGYGKSLRRFFASHDPVLLVDLGPGIFENAIVDTNILVLCKVQNKGRLSAVTLNSGVHDASLSDFINQHKNNLPEMGVGIWLIGDQTEQNLKLKIERLGKPLKRWNVNIYRGVVTGLNEAFIIDTLTRDRLVAADPKCAEILKPILRGRDVKRYNYNWSGLWIIFIPWHYFEYKPVFVEQFPIPPIIPANQDVVDRIERLVDNILAAKKHNPSADTSLSEQEIDRLVYGLYELTDAEIAIVEGKS